MVKPLSSICTHWLPGLAALHRIVRSWGCRETCRSCCSHFIDWGAVLCGVFAVCVLCAALLLLWAVVVSGSLPLLLQVLQCCCCCCCGLLLWAAAVSGPSPCEHAPDVQEERAQAVPGHQQLMGLHKCGDELLVRVGGLAAATAYACINAHSTASSLRVVEPGKGLVLQHCSAVPLGLRAAWLAPEHHYQHDHAITTVFVPAWLGCKCVGDGMSGTGRKSAGSVPSAA